MTGKPAITSGKLEGVHKIYLHGCNQITDQGLQYLKRVHIINLTYCQQITDQGLKYLEGVHHNWFICLLSNNRSRFTIFSWRVRSSIGKLKEVHTIDLCGCHQITDQGLQYLKGAHKIESNGIRRITNQALQY